MADYYIDKARAEQRADLIRAEVTQSSVLRPPLFPKKDEYGDHSRLYRRLFISVAFVLLIIVMLLMNNNPAKAQQVISSGDGASFHDTMLSFTLGRYYFIKGDYDKAAEYFAEAVESLPIEVYEYDDTFANLYLYLGYAQEAVGMHEDALESYALYIEYSGADVELEDIVLEDVEDSVVALMTMDQ